MARYAPLWQQFSSYAASQDRSLIAALWPSGGLRGGAVTAVANTMTASVAPGTIAVPLQAGQGSALCMWDANETVTIAAAPPSGQSRIDLVVAQVRDNALDSGGNNDFIFSAVTGTAAASNPAVPAVPTNAAAVAQVLVPGAAGNLNTATITMPSSPLSPGDVLHAAVFRNAAFNATSTKTAIAFDTVDRDLTGLWVAGRTAFVLPVTGWWQASSAVTARPASGYQLCTMLDQAGSLSATIAQIAVHSSTTYPWTSLAQRSFYAVAGDTLQVSAQIQGATSVAGVAGRNWTYATLDYLGTG
jgi:hypothetical protein